MNRKYDSCPGDIISEERASLSSELRPISDILHVPALLTTMQMDSELNFVWTRAGLGYNAFSIRLL